MFWRLDLRMVLFWNLDFYVFSMGEEENQIMGFIDVKEKVIKTLGEFLEGNKEYIIEVYISNPVTNHIIGRMYVATDRTFKTDDKGFTLEWDNRQDIVFNNFSIPYEDILVCYKEVDEYEQEMIFVILKCGISIDFGCCGMTI